jgi:hypothetical protein
VGTSSGDKEELGAIEENVAMILVNGTSTTVQRKKSIFYKTEPSKEKAAQFTKRSLHLISPRDSTAKTLF